MSITDTTISTFPSLPEWVEELRPHQIQAVEEIADAYSRGASVVMLDAPTGSGKTLIAEMVRRYMRKRALYVCSSKTLQDQFMRDFDYAAVLKGRSNYPTMTKPFPEYTAADCTKQSKGGECYWCPNVHECAYERAKAAALRNHLTVINTSYLLAEANYVGNMRGRGLVVIDECDVLERELMGFVELNIGERTLRSLRVDEPKKGSHKTTIAAWMEEELQPAIKRELGKMGLGLTDVREIRRRASLESLLSFTRMRLAEIVTDNWIRDNDAGPMVMKPVRVDGYGEKVLWQHGQRWLLMSATIISPDELAESLGLGDREWEVVKVPMTFPVESRRIHVAPVADMAYTERETSWPIMARAIERILERHPDERILVHSVSYKFTKYLCTALRSPRVVSYTSAEGRAGALADFLSRPNGVLIASSFDRGVDLRGDECRVVVVPKMPYPSLADTQVSARRHQPGGKMWYTVQAVRTLIQMTGRATRSMDDWSVTYILDKSFMSNIWRQHKVLLPGWWKEALDMRFPVRELL